MQAYKTQTIRFPLVVTPERLTRFISALPQGNSPKKLTVRCVDGLTLYLSGLEQFLELPNAAPNAIESLTIQSCIDDGSRCEITFSNTILGSASYTVSGAQDFVTVNSDLIAKHLSAMAGERPHFVANSTILAEVFGPLLGGLAVGLCLISIMLGFLAKVLSIPAALMLFFTGILLTVFAVRFHRLVDVYFPRVSFCIGNGLERYENTIRTRRLGGAAALVALVVSVLANFLTMFVTRK